MAGSGVVDLMDIEIPFEFLPDAKRIVELANNFSDLKALNTQFEQDIVGYHTGFNMDTLLSPLYVRQREYTSFQDDSHLSIGAAASQYSL